MLTKGTGGQGFTRAPSCLIRQDREGDPVPALGCAQIPGARGIKGPPVPGRRKWKKKDEG